MPIEIEGQAPERILRSIVDITGERNFDEIRLSLVRTIFELLPARRLSFCNLSHGRSEVRLNELLLARRTDGGALQVQGLGQRGMAPDALQREVIRSGRPVSQQGEDSYVECSPVVYHGKVIELIRTELEGHDGGEMLSAMMRLYTNILDLIRDKETDTLTGMFNRRAFDNQLEGLVRQGSPPELNGHAQTWWLVMVDADNFKAINDGYGHLIGDEVLILLARLMREHFRAVDNVYRYGGEEFAVVLAPSTARAAREAVERLVALVRGHRFPQVGQVTISAGLAAIDHFDHISSVIGRADRALYYAKRHGRDQACDYHDLVEAGLLPGESAGNELELF